MRLALLCLLLAGCASVIPSTDPRWVAKIFADQPDDTPTLCRANVEDARDSVDIAFDRKMDIGLVGALVDGGVSAARWRTCAETYLRSASPAQATDLDEAIGSAYRALIGRRDFEKSPALQERLRAMQALYLSPVSAQSHASSADERLFAELRAAVAANKLGPVARVLGEELLAAVDLEYGRFQGRLVDGALLDALYAGKDVTTLERMAAHLPTKAGRDDARRRIIRLRIASSPFPEVRAHAAEVEERVLATGMNAIALDEQKPVSATLDPTRFAYRGVRVEQDLARQSARLVGYAGDDPSSPALEEVQLGGTLQVHVEGIASPLTLCGSPAAQDPTPCIAPKDVHIGDAFGSIDADGAFRFTHALSMDDAVALGAKKDRLALTVVIGNESLVTERWPLSYARPKALVMTTQAPGGNAPDLFVTVDHTDPARYVFTADDGHARALAVIEAADVASFRVKSAGGKGANGANGMGGMSGTSGGECGYGTAGSDGSDGSDGGPGGDGGDVTVHVLCGATRCDDDVRTLRQVVLSVAGASGDGGAGGAGGSGGAAGTDRQPWIGNDADGNHIVLDEGCRGGSAGLDGSSGRSGSPGTPGHAGRVRFVPQMRSLGSNREGT